MVSRGHNLQALLHEYPIDLVLNLHRAAKENRYDEITAGLKMQAVALNIAVINALDATIGTGKGKVLETWLKDMDAPMGGRQGDLKQKPKPTRSKLSPDAVAFFSGLPIKSKKG